MVRLCDQRGESHCQLGRPPYVFCAAQSTINMSIMSLGWCSHTPMCLGLLFGFTLLNCLLAFFDILCLNPPPYTKHVERIRRRTELERESKKSKFGMGISEL